MNPINPADNEVFEGIVEIFDGTNWIRKGANNGYSTFFPKNWDKEKTFEEVVFVTSRRPQVRASGPGAGNNQYQGVSSTGSVRIDYYQGSTQIISSFPIKP